MTLKSSLDEKIALKQAIVEANGDIDKLVDLLAVFEGDVKNEAAILKEISERLSHNNPEQTESLKSFLLQRISDESDNQDSEAITASYEQNPGMQSIAADILEYYENIEPTSGNNARDFIRTVSAFRDKIITNETQNVFKIIKAAATQIVNSDDVKNVDSVDSTSNTEVKFAKVIQQIIQDLRRYENKDQPNKDEDSIPASEPNKSPIALDDNASVAEDGSVVINLLANDIDADGDSLSIKSLGAVAHGTLADNGNGTVTYTPHSNYYGADSFNYTVSDGQGGTKKANVSIAVTSVNDAPAALALSAASIKENASIGDVVGILSASDVDGDSLTFHLTSDAGKKFEIVGNELRIKNALDFESDTLHPVTIEVRDGNGGNMALPFTITVSNYTIDDTTPNTAPVASDDSASVAEDGSVIINLLTNDSDGDGDTLNIVSLGAASHGTVVDNGDGTATYTPDSDYNGGDTFTYTINDGRGGSSSASVSIAVSSINDVPTSLALSDMSTNENASIGDVVGILSASDADGDSLTFHLTGDADNKFEIIGNELRVKNLLDFESDTSHPITVEVRDDNGGNMALPFTINVSNDTSDDGSDTDIKEPVIEAPDIDDIDDDIAITEKNIKIDRGDRVKLDLLDGRDDLTLVSMTSPAEGMVMKNDDGTITYITNASRKGKGGHDSINYTVQDDDGNVTTAQILIDIENSSWIIEENGNIAPRARDDHYVMDEDSTITINNIHANDVDGNGDTVKLVSIENIVGGNVFLNPDYTLTFTPDKDFDGKASFVYVGGDEKGGMDTAKVYIEVNGINDNPVASNETYYMFSGSLQTGNLLSNVVDIDSVNLTVELLSEAQHGTFTVESNGEFSYKFDKNFIGSEEVSFKVYDGDGGSDTATVKFVTVDDVVATNDVFSVTAGRVSNVDVVSNDIFDIDRHEINILTQPTDGHVSINPDGTLAVVLTNPEFEGLLSFDYELTDGNGVSSTATAHLDVSKALQAKGWGYGDHYTLQTDANDRTIVEAGEKHRKIFVSNSEDALTVEEFAEMIGEAPQDLHWKDFRGRADEYGIDEAQPLSPELAQMLWEQLHNDTGASSNWLLFERGHTYGREAESLFLEGLSGESALHPIVFGSYGEGDLPLFKHMVFHAQKGMSNVVVKDLSFEYAGIKVKGTDNLLVENFHIEKGGELTFQKYSNNITLRHSSVIDITNETPDGDYWRQSQDRESGFFADTTNGLLIEHVFADHNGWADGYDYNLSTEHGQPPSLYSHNFYVQRDNSDVTFRDNITMRGASAGAQIRPGGFIENNLYLDNNLAGNFLGGMKRHANDEELPGNFTLFMDNITTSAGYKKVSEDQGALSQGFTNKGWDSVLIGNIITHLADPNNPAELEEKQVANTILDHKKDPLFDDTIVYNWVGGKHADKDGYGQRNVDGLDETVLDQTTIQLFAADIMGQETATIEEFADYLRSFTNDNIVNMPSANLINEFFRQGFGLGTDLRTDATTVRFIPNELGDGVRWDNKLNWSTDDIAGSVAGDNVDLAGSLVYFSGTHSLNNLDFGDLGHLQVRQGYLKINSIEVGDRQADLDIGLAGQFWTTGAVSGGRLDIDVSDGRFGNMGDFSGLFNMNVTGGEVLLGTMDGNDFIVGNNSSLSIAGDNAKVGFDGAAGGTSTLEFKGDSDFTITMNSLDFSTIREFRSGHFGLDQPDIHSVVNLGESTTQLTLDMSLVTGASGVHTVDLIKVDELLGNVGDIDVVGLGSNGLNGVTLKMDYSTDKLSMVMALNDNSMAGVKMEMYGSNDSDVFYVMDDENVSQEIHDFDTDNDAIDISNLLSDMGENDDIAEYVQLQSSGNGVTNILIDKDGGADNFEKAVSVHHNNALTDLEELIDSNQIVVS